MYSANNTAELTSQILAFSPKFVPNATDVNTGRFIMFSVITNSYNKKTKGPTLMELLTAAGKLKKFFYNARVWQQLEYRIDVCLVTRGSHIQHL
jgi:hypothetical protein